MKTFVAATALLALSPLAHAQVRCAEIAYINSTGMDEFESLIGDRINGSYSNAKIKLDDATTCTIDFGAEFSLSYDCIWDFPSRAEAERAYAVQAAALAGCLTGWRTEILSAGMSDTAGVISMGVKHFSIGDRKKSFWELVLVDPRYFPESPNRLQISLVLH